MATFVLGFFHCFQIYTAYTGGDFPLGRLACHVQKMQLDDQPVTGTAARRVPSSHKQYCTVSAACFWRSCKKQQHARTAAQVQTVRACFTLSERAKIADRLNEQRPQGKPPLNVLIQINISDEASKSGIAPPDMLPLAEHICQLPHLRLRGLMAIPAPTNVLTEQQNAFTQMARLFDKLKAAFPNQQIDTLSMGMTDDMQSAIQCGSTMVRIGTAIFGARDYHKA